MPILNPSTQIYLLNKKKAKTSANANNFYRRYLKIASRHIFRDLSTMQTSMTFRKDLKQCISLVIRKFGCRINEVDLENPTISNIYKYLYNSMNSSVFDQTNKKSKKVEGNYFKLTDNFETSFFKPNTFYSLRHSWFFSDTPIAILTINTSYSMAKPDFCDLIKLEISLMKASGFTLVLCANLNNLTDFLLHLIQKYQFAEVHLTSENEDNLINFFNKSSFDFSFLKGFMYIYSPYISKKSQFREKYKKCKKILRVKLLTFSEDIKKSIKIPFFQIIRPFMYCKGGFKHQYLRVELSNTSLYNDKNDFDSFVPLETSGISQCYVSPDDFLNWQNNRVKVIYDDVSKNRRYDRYVNFEDLHIIRKDFYVDDPLATSKIKLAKINQINVLEKKINEKIEKRKNKSFKKDYIKSLSQEKLIDNSLKYVSYAYAFCENSLNNDFSIHRPQIYTAMKVSKSFFKKNNDDVDNIIMHKKWLENELSRNLYTTKANKNDKISKEILLKKAIELYIEITSLNLQNFNYEKLNNLFRSFFDKPMNYFKDLLQKDYSEIMKNISELGRNLKDDFFKQYFELIDSEIKKNLSKHHKGVIYQVDTGEGKSCIICLIAAILALNGKTVHICSSNIKLANRDYMDSFDFFRQLKLKSAVFVHENELPIPPKKKEKSMVEKSKDEVDEINIHSGVSDCLIGFNDFDYGGPSDNNEDIIKIDTIFKNNFGKYFELNTESDKTVYSKYYYNDDFDYYNEEQFYNSSKMNFAVCGLDCDNNIPRNKPNIIFSTFVNFECFYLKLLELSPGYIDDYYGKCALLIDEADSILIDEITNGTIVSRDIKSNSKEILKFVYDQRLAKVSAKKTFKIILEKWPECTDLSIKDIEQMYSEVDIVNNKEFENGKKYSIEEIKVKNYKRMKKLIKETLNVVQDIAVNVGKNIISLLASDNKEPVCFDEDEDDDDDDDDDDDEIKNGEEDLNEENTSVTIFRHIVPFDYDHKGILEPNKEFGGFIQQFIAIKESGKYQNMIIKDMSLNYLYVSHPIFVKLYNKVCGFTGTVGGLKERNIYEQEYNLKTVTIPRNKPNQRIELPMILCDTIEDRNKCIVFEILQFHNQGNPVLAIFQDLKEIEIVAKMIYSIGIQQINFFDGKDDTVLPDRIAGIKGAISLGTNYCGRGTNILVNDKSLHVIISYYTSNVRVMNQARGRTARQGQKGTVRVICLKEQFLYPEMVYDDEMKNLVNEFSIKNRIQKDYISFFQEFKPWIFSNDMKEQKFSIDDIIKMREARINVNRIVAFNFRFPLKMKVDTFLKVQSQKIFSIFNCPNSKYTWRLFQKYIREMILEAWSIKVNEVDETFFNKKENRKYKKEIEKLKDLHLNIYSPEYQKKRRELNRKYAKNIEEYEKILEKSEEELLCLINNYIPKDIHDIVPTFMHIFTIVVDTYENDVLSTFKNISNAYIHHNKNEFLSCQIGFKPFSLFTESGARITYRNFKKTNYIIDPEMKYMKKTPKNRICLLSITEKIDDVFNLIFQKVNEIIGSKTFLKFFMRRTLCGCEFGICLNFPMCNQGVTDQQCIVDRDPLFVFTICVKSIIPVLAGVLIILLVYLASMAKDIGEWFTCFPAKLTKELAMKAVGLIVSTVSEELFHFGLDKIIELLQETLNKQLKKLRSINSNQAIEAANIIDDLKSLFTSKTGQKINEKFSSFLGDKIHVTVDWQELLKSCLDPERIMKISFFIILCASTFIMNFSCRKNAIQQAQKDSDEFEGSFNENLTSKRETKMKTIIKSISNREQKIIEKENLANNTVIEENYYYYYYEEEEEDDDAIKKFSTEERKEIEKQNIKSMLSLIDEISDFYPYKLYSFKPLDLHKKISDFIDDKSIKKITSHYYVMSSVFKKGIVKNKFLKLHYIGLNKKVFKKEVSIYATNKFPSILNIVGYSIYKNNFDLYFDNKCISTLETLFSEHHHDKYNLTKKIIIAYGIALALKYLHFHHIAYLNLIPENVLLDSSLFPYLSGFYKSIFIINKNDIVYFANDVFNYGLILTFLIKEHDMFSCFQPSLIFSLVEKPDSYISSCPNSELRNLIVGCWERDKNDEKSFSKICDSLESIAHNDHSINYKEFQKYGKMFKNCINENELNIDFIIEKHTKSFNDQNEVDTSTTNHSDTSIMEDF